MSKPTSKVMQISTTILPEVSQYSPCVLIVDALCEDGSIWRKSNHVEEWTCILEAPKEETNNE